jgi:hypothetical protein
MKYCLQELEFTAIAVIRGETDIAYSSLYHHARIGFDRLIVISHVEHVFLRETSLQLRQAFPGLEINIIEIEAVNGFTKFKGQWVNGALSMLLDRKKINIVYGFDADEFLYISSFGSVKELFNAFVEELGATDLTSLGPSLLKLPWSNLLSSNDMDMFPDNDFTGECLEYSYYRLVSPRPIPAKMVFLYKPGIRVHMGYHYLSNAKTDKEINVHPASLDFISKYGLCVHHIPLRKISQFKSRLRSYKTSADPNAKYNRLILGGNNLTESIFALCLSSEPMFSTYEEASASLGYKLDPNKDKTFIEFLTLPRVKVGAILGR